MECPPIAAGPIDKVQRDPKVIAAYLGTEVDATSTAAEEARPFETEAVGAAVGVQA